MSVLHIRPATEADVPFLVWVVKTAEASGTDVISYQRLFDLTDTELDDLLTNALAEEVDGCDLSYQNYVVAEWMGERVGACAAWIEADDYAPSHLIKGQMLAWVLGNDRLQAAREKIDLINEVNVLRDPGTLQLESFAVVPEHRGKGITRAMIQHHIDQYKNKRPELQYAQIAMMSSNLQGLRAYEKAGFQLLKQMHSVNPRVRELLPGTGKILLQKTI